MADQRVQPRSSSEPGVVSRLASGTAAFAKKHKVISFSYVLGIVLLLFGTGFRISEEARDRFERTLDKIDVNAIERAYTRYAEADYAYRRSQGWFWSCDSTCHAWKARMEEAKGKYESLRKLESQTMSEAKQELGIFSEYGVQETRDQFWSSFQGGKDFAKRQSMWDLFFTGLRWGKDEELFTVIVRWLFNVLANFTIGVIIAFCVFVWRIFTLISTYQPDPVTAITYATLAIISASAFLLTYLFAIYAATVGTVAVGAKMVVDHNRRLQQDPNYQRRRMQYQHPHSH